MQKIKFFPKVIGFFINPNHNKIQNTITKKCLDIEKEYSKGGDNWLTNVYNTSGKINLYKQKEFKTLLKWIDDRVLDYCKDLNILGTLSNKNAWFNIYRKGDSQEFHNHPSSSLSVIYYVDGDSKSANTVFTDFDMVNLKCSEYNEDNSMSWKIPFEKGKLIIFKSNTLHAVEKHTTINERITLAINYNIILN